MSNQEIQKNRRIEAFMKEYGELVAKHRVDFANFPVFIPREDGRGAFDVRVQTVPIDMDELKKAQLDKSFISK